MVAAALPPDPQPPQDQVKQSFFEIFDQKFYFEQQLHMHEGAVFRGSGLDISVCAWESNWGWPDVWSTAT